MAPRSRWGHRLPADAELVVDADLSLRAAHELAVDAEHQLTHRVPGLAAATVHPRTRTVIRGAEPHPDLSRHRRASRG